VKCEPCVLGAGNGLGAGNTQLKLETGSLSVKFDGQGGLTARGLDEAYQRKLTPGSFAAKFDEAHRSKSGGGGGKDGGGDGGRGEAIAESGGVATGAASAPPAPVAQISDESVVNKIVTNPNCKVGRCRLNR
jgi:hypothetical protein